MSWDERNWCHLEPTSLACPDSDNAWLMGWVSGDPIFLVSCTSESDVRQMAVLSQPQLLSVCHGGTECGGSLALWVCRVRPKCRNTDLYSYQRRGCPTGEDTANLGTGALVPTASHSSHSGGSTVPAVPRAPPMATAAVDQGRHMIQASQSATFPGTDAEAQGDRSSHLPAKELGPLAAT